MLVPAISKKAELLEKFSREVYSEKYFWYCGYAHCHELPEIKVEDNVYQYAIINKSGDVAGYFAYSVEPYADSVFNFGLYSFGKGDITVGIDVFAELEKLVENHHRIEWVVVGGNKIKKNYDRFCKKHGGSIAVLHDSVRDENGNYHNSYVYEIVKGTDEDDTERTP